MTLGLLHLRLGDQGDALERRGTFTTVLTADGSTWGDHRPTLLIADDTVLELGHIKGEPARVATGWRRVRYTRFLELDEQIPLATLLAGLDPPFHRLFEERAPGDLVLPDRTADAVIAALSEVSTEFAGARDLFLRQKRRTPGRLRGQALQAAAQEADAVRLAIDIARVPRTALRGVRPDGETPYLQALSEARVYEDQAIDYDAGRFLDFGRIERPNGIVHFANGNERLTVLNVNRRPLEQVTGADLIYHNESQESFVLVQYKTMAREGDPGETKLVVRPSSDGNLESELDRMRQFVEALGDGTVDQWRLHPGFCFLKLCRPVLDLDYPERELVGGMYLPLEYWDLLAISPEVKGPRGGIVMTYENVPRRIDNSLFVELVRGGWIGSRAETTTTITDLVIQA